MPHDRATKIDNCKHLFLDSFIHNCGKSGAKKFIFIFSLSHLNSLCVWQFSWKTRSKEMMASLRNAFYWIWHDWKEVIAKNKLILKEWKKVAISVSEKMDMMDGIMWVNWWEINWKLFWWLLMEVGLRGTLDIIWL